MHDSKTLKRVKGKEGSSLPAVQGLIHHSLLDQNTITAQNQSITKKIIIDTPRKVIR